jgi:hypothetical protein
MPGLVYLLCAATSLASAILLWRGLFTRGGGLLFWSALYFFGMAINNVLMFVNTDAVQGVDLSIWPNLVSLISIGVLNVALVWHAT